MLNFKRLFLNRVNVMTPRKARWTNDFSTDTIPP